MNQILLFLPQRFIDEEVALAGNELTATGAERIRMREVSWIWIVFEGHGDLGHLLLIILTIRVVLRLKYAVLFALFVNIAPVAGYLLKLHNNYIYYHVTPSR